MLPVKNIGKQVFKLFWKLQALRTLARLKNNSSGYTKIIAGVLDEVLKNKISNEEEIWINKIERLREKLEASTEDIELVDYGAIEPDLEIRERELNKGRTIKTTVGAKCKSGSELFFWVFILFKLIRKFRPSTCLELGACMGLSASYQASALELNGKGRMITIEGDSSLAWLAGKNFDSLGLKNAEVVNGRFQDKLPEVLEKFKPFDFVFIDGHLDGKATVNNFDLILPYLSEKAIFVIDNISWSESMKKGWEKIELNEKIKLTFYLRQMGICVLDNSLTQKNSYRIPLLY
jgi:precorrin-6B methylase 2